MQPKDINKVWAFTLKTNVMIRCALLLYTFTFNLTHFASPLHQNIDMTKTNQVSFKVNLIRNPNTHVHTRSKQGREKVVKSEGERCPTLKIILYLTCNFIYLRSLSHCGKDSTILIKQDTVHRIVFRFMYTGCSHTSCATNSFCSRRC